MPYFDGVRLVNALENNLIELKTLKLEAKEKDAEIIALKAEIAELKKYCRELGGILE